MAESREQPPGTAHAALYEGLPLFSLAEDERVGEDRRGQACGEPVREP